MAVIPATPIRGVTDVWFDLDDTLLDTTSRYNRIIREFSAWLNEHFKGEFGRENIEALREEMDVLEMNTWGFRRERFPASFASTYRKLCEMSGHRHDAEIEEACRALADRVYHDVPEMFGEVRPVLAALKSRYRLALYTLGDHAVQSRKVRFHALGDVFDQVFIVDFKDTPTLKKCLNGLAVQEVVLVGDSFRGEIQPAVELGVHAVHIQRPEVWQFLSIPVTGDYMQITQLDQLNPILL